MSIRKNNYGYKSSFENVFLFSLFSLLTFTFIFNDDGCNFDFRIIISSYVIVAFCLLKIFIFNKKPYSLNNIFYIFYLFFFGISPAIQHKFDVNFWSANSFNNDFYFYMNIFFFVVILIYSISYNYFNSKIRNKIFSKSIVGNKKKVRIKYILLLSLLSCICFLVIEDFNFYSVFFRANIIEFNTTSKNNTYITLIVENFLRPIPVVCLLVYRFYYKKKRIVYDLLLLLLLLLSNFPTGMPRFKFAALYLPIIFLYFPLIKKKNNFKLMFCIGFLVIFPFMDQFRSNYSVKENISINLEIFKEAHFDTYHNTIDAIRNKEITYGRQIVGVFLFFIPRNLWKEKPVGSGAYFAKKYKYDYTNIGFSFFGEGYINFGFIGVFIFTLLLAKFLSYYDYYYWNNHLKPILHMYYLTFLGLLFFILRGDLMSSIAYSVGIFLSFFTTYKLSTIKF